MDTFGVSNTPAAAAGGLDAMDPKEEKDFDEFREALGDKIVKYNVS